MVSIFSSYLDNTSLLDVVQLYLNTIILYVTDFFSVLRDSEAVTYLKVVRDTFDDLQWNLLKILCGLILFNLILIVIVWKYYGESICERFMTNPTLREIEELRASVSKLKLPKEHTPRI